MRKLIPLPILLLLVPLLTACPSADTRQKLEQGAFNVVAHMLDSEIKKLDAELASIGDEDVTARFKEYVQEFGEIKNELANLHSKSQLPELASSLLSLYGSARCDIQKLPEGRAKEVLTRVFNRLDKFLLPFADYLPRTDGAGDAVANNRLNFGVCP